MGALSLHLGVISRLVRDPRAGYRQSLSVLEHAKKVKPGLVTKSSIMLGCGEEDQDVLQALKGESGYPLSFLVVVIVVCMCVCMRVRACVCVFVCVHMST